MSIYTDNWIDQRRDQIVESLRNIVRFRTTEGPAEDGAPFGPEVKKCLGETLRTASDLGLKTRDLDGYCGTVDAEGGREMLGILAHLDVVPEGTGWSCDPYGAEIIDGKVYGRGTLDDKGPAIAALYAIRSVIDLGIPLKKGVRLILGSDEECGSSDLKYFLHDFRIFGICLDTTCIQRSCSKARIR